MSNDKISRPQRTGRRWLRCVMAGQPFYGEVALGNGTLFTTGAFLTDDGIFVGVQNHKCWTFAATGDWSYVAERLNLLPSDAQNLTDWINAQLGAVDVEEVGRYNPDRCEINLAEPE